MMRQRQMLRGQETGQDSGCMPPRSTYPEEVEADGQMGLLVVVPVPGFLEQGHQHTAWHQECPALLGPPHRQQELRVLPKRVWNKTR